MRGRGVARGCNCRSRTPMVVVVVVLLAMLAVRVESTRVREMVAAIEASSVVEADEFHDSVQENGAAATMTTTTTTTRASSNAGRDGVEDPAWDEEVECPPAQRQRDRSLWGMSKRLVPTGPNPLHN